MPASLQEGCVAYMASCMLPVLMCIALAFYLDIQHHWMLPAPFGAATGMQHM